jgi:hypothetical protein
MFFSWILPISAIPHLFPGTNSAPPRSRTGMAGVARCDRGISNLKKLHEYLQHAAECRDMARTASPAHRQHLEQMAETWEQLAEARKRKLEKHEQSPEDDYPITD